MKMSYSSGVGTSLEGSNFLDDFSQHRIELFSRLDLRLFRGLQFSLFGSVARIKDQIFLPREGATDQEVLVRRQALGTGYRYFMNVSLSYSFGSIFNNIVNPRFDAGGGGVIFFN